MKPGEVWRNPRGAERRIRSVHNGLVFYSRPTSQDSPTWEVAPVRLWEQWAATARLVRRFKESDKDWMCDAL